MGNEEKEGCSEKSANSCLQNEHNVLKQSINRLISSKFMPSQIKAPL